MIGTCNLQVSTDVHTDQIHCSWRIYCTYLDEERSYVMVSKKEYFKRYREEIILAMEKNSKYKRQQQDFWRRRKKIINFNFMLLRIKNLQETCPVWSSPHTLYTPPHPLCKISFLFYQTTFRHQLIQTIKDISSLKAWIHCLKLCTEIKILPHLKQAELKIPIFWY